MHFDNHYIPIYCSATPPSTSFEVSHCRGSSVKLLRAANFISPLKKAASFIEQLLNTPSCNRQRAVGQCPTFGSNAPLSHCQMNGSSQQGSSGVISRDDGRLSLAAEEMQPASQIRQLFKHYRRRDLPQPSDMSNVIDLRVTQPTLRLQCLPMPTHAESNKLNGAGNCSADEVATGLGLRPLSEWTISTFEHRPGLYVLNDVMGKRTQLDYLRLTLLHYPEPPNVTNLSSLGTYVGGGVFTTAGGRWSRKLRWATLGNDYSWSEKVYSEMASRRPLPVELQRLAKLVVCLLGLNELEGMMEPDAAIVNYYPLNSHLAPHVDKSERLLSRPLVSLSLGQSAIYLTGGTTLDDGGVDAILLHSGDVLVMAGEQRLVYHGVPRILQMTRFSREDMSQEWRRDDGAHQVLEYANECRVNITIRQVD